MARLMLAASMLGALLAAPAAAQDAKAPVLDCNLGFEGLRSWVHGHAGTQTGRWRDFDFVGIASAEPDTWRVEIAFTSPGHPAHPSVIARTLRKQVTGVWTAESKGCGYGNSAEFANLMADMKAGDTELTNESRAAVEREKQRESPLAAP